MFYLHDASIRSMVVHRIGNAALQEACFYSKRPTPIANEELNDTLRAFFLSPFKVEDYYRFLSSEQMIGSNPVMESVVKMFEDHDSFIAQSRKIGEWLYSVSVNPSTKSGELYVVHFKDCYLHGMECEAIGIFKSDSRDIFLKTDLKETSIEMSNDEGINVGTLNKGILIFNTEQEGLVCLLAEMGAKTNQAEAELWKDSFLGVVQDTDSLFAQTSAFVNMTATFVNEYMPEKFEVTQAQKAGIMNNIAGYMKTNKDNEINVSNFAKDVFIDDDVVDLYKDFRKDYENARGFQIEEEFVPNLTAFSKNKKSLKPIIRLDNNFEIIVKGNGSDRIVLDTDENGNKFYKLYFDVEH